MEAEKIGVLGADEDDSALLTEPITVSKQSNCCGRTVGLCDCISPKTIFIICGIVGSILLILGILALVGYCCPANATGAASHLHAALNFIASKIATDPFVLTCFTFSIGGAFSFACVLGLAVHKCFPRPEAKRSPLTETPT